MDKNHLDKDFAKIAELFQIYQDSFSLNNNASLLEQIKSKIVVQFWKTIQKAAISSEMKEQSDIIVKKIVKCLETYSNKEATEFCKLTYTSIIKSLKTKADTEAFENKSGMHISTDDDKLRKRIGKAYRQYKQFNSGDKKEFLEYAVSFCGFNKESVEEYLFPKQSTSLFLKSSDGSGEEYCVADKYTNSDKGNDFSETLNSKNEISEQLEKINALWLKQKENAQPVFSELLTRELLESFVRNNVSEKIIDILLKQDFICKEMAKQFFEDATYKLPSQQDVGKKYGLTKAGASKKLSRFFDKLK